MPQSESNDYIIQHTKNWLHSFIIELTICPFAKREVERGSLRIEVSAVKKIKEALENLITEIQRLDNEPQIETTLLIFPSLCSDFFDYLDFVDLAEVQMSDCGYEGIYQLATFHPDYCFEESDFDDPANYTNRSPYPMLHLLREDSVEKAIAFYGDTEKIPEANIKTMHQLGLEKIQKILTSCIPKD
ncbi:MAG: DUF1415 domain-containing protein [Tatlockia sp.]|nr:DUF1415 domain-containing protein [Tatlockia sp.]